MINLGFDPGKEPLLWLAPATCGVVLQPRLWCWASGEKPACDLGQTCRSSITIIVTNTALTQHREALSKFLSWTNSLHQHHLGSMLH